MKPIRILILALCLLWISSASQVPSPAGERERLSMDFGWRFALGHATDAKKDFDHGTGYFSYLAKTGYGDGAAAPDFDDRAWRKLDVPHDWCVELPFDARGGHSHGYRAIGRNFPENSIGWYRKTFAIPAADLGKRISIEFDGVYRNSIVWVNGFYLGTERSGYTGFRYDITDYLNYGGDNVVAVRVDATMEEGWYYEGAGIYRHAWLSKTSPLHIAWHGTFVTVELNDQAATVRVRTTIINESSAPSVFDLDETIFDAAGNVVASGSRKNLTLPSGETKEFSGSYTVARPSLWTLETPTLHKLQTGVRERGKVLDTYETPFGIRTVRFDPNEGFFLNGKHLKILGTAVHQDHAGVGTALPDALVEYRIRRLKEMGSNGIRTAHNPPSPELLDVCDRMGMLVVDENRLMGSSEEHFNCLERLMKRDRNHPSVVLWSLGNEEWAIEGNVKGARIGATMQAFALRLDSSRGITAALSGGWEGGIGRVIQVMGYNYIVQGNIDGHHAQFPLQAGIGTEESNTIGTRGVYETDSANAHLAPTNRLPENVGTESGWQFYSARPFLAGLFYWTGFDYRGEPHPYAWPAVSSQFGILDLCGFPKDIFYYLKSWWGTEPVLHIMPHWNWQGRGGEARIVTVYSNCEQVSLILNGRSLGKKDMPVNSHLEWDVKYEPGVLMAHGYRGGKEILTEKVITTGDPAALTLTADRSTLRANGQDVSVITVAVTDSLGLVVPVAGNEIAFSLAGAGRIVGVGNGDPSSHEADRMFETVRTVKIENRKELSVNSLSNRPEIEAGVDDAGWKEAFTGGSADWRVYTDSLIVVRGTFELPEMTPETEVTLFPKSITENQSMYVNGQRVGVRVSQNDQGQSFKLEHQILKTGNNVYAITGRRFRKRNQWDVPNTDPGLLQIIAPAPQWNRKAFNGLAQILVQSSLQPGEMVLSASSPGLKAAKVTIRSVDRNSVERSNK